MAMFLNHSCDPNCETVQDAGDRVFISTIRHVAAGEGPPRPVQPLRLRRSGPGLCCAAPNCRATMYSPFELERRARIARRNSTSTPQLAHPR
jgi:hypothetical protein